MQTDNKGIEIMNMDNSKVVGEKTFIDGHEFVDLGLPDGTLWATCNIGASRPEEYGDYFAWGETQPKDSYVVVNYKYCEGDMRSLTKYCNSISLAHWGRRDNLIELLPEDDAATVNWGGKWKMPTIGQCLILIDSEWTTTEWTTLHGVYGRKITSNSNGRCIFLPAAGCRFSTVLDGVSNNGNYWSSMLPLDVKIFPSDNEAYRLRISAAPTDYDSHIFRNCYRYYGLSVRPVYNRDED